jgi:hypothetical protein
MWPKPRKWFEPPPSMSAWYWIVYCAMPVIGMAILWYQPRSLIFLTGLYVGAWQLVLIPLMWRKAPPRARPWVTLLLVAFAVALFWTTLRGWPF